MTYLTTPGPIPRENLGRVAKVLRKARANNVPAPEKPSAKAVAEARDLAQRIMHVRKLKQQGRDHG